MNDVEGVPCQMDGCNELELLPTTCSKCGKVLCSFHAPYAAHRCPSNHDYIVPTCPICSCKIAVRPGDAVDRIVSMHIDSGCTQYLAPVHSTSVEAQQCLLNNQHPPSSTAAKKPVTGANAFSNIRPTGVVNNTSSNPPIVTSTANSSGGFGGNGRILGGAAKPGLNTHQSRANFCSYEGCTKNELVLILCSGCKHSFCIEHRYPGDHKCPRAGNATPPPADPSPIANPDKPLVARQQPHDLRARHFVNTYKTAYDKQRIAQGITVAVFVERSFNAPPFFATLQRRTVMGRVLDTLCRHADVPNTNNDATVPEAQRWYIFLLSSPKSVAVDMAMPMDTILEDVAHDGDVLYLGKGPELPISIRQQVEANPLTTHEVLKQAAHPNSKSTCTTM